MDQVKEQSWKVEDDFSDFEIEGDLVKSSKEQKD
jgi:hypothetical protein